MYRNRCKKKKKVEGGCGPSFFFSTPQKIRERLFAFPLLWNPLRRRYKQWDEVMETSRKGRAMGGQREKRMGLQGVQRYADPRWEEEEGKTKDNYTGERRI